MRIDRILAFILPASAVLAGCTLLVDIKDPPQENTSVCGNHILETGEQCDGDDLNGATCAQLASGSTGTLVCTPDCMLDTSGCTVQEDCRNGHDDNGDG